MCSPCCVMSRSSFAHSSALHNLLVAGEEMGRAPHARFPMAFTNKDRGREERERKEHCEAPALRGVLPCSCDLLMLLVRRGSTFGCTG